MKFMKWNLLRPGVFSWLESTRRRASDRDINKVKALTCLPLRGDQSSKSPLERGFRGVLFLLLVLSSNNNLQAQTLETYQTEAAQNNPSLRASYHQYLAVLEKAPQVSSFPDPEIGFAYFISPIETRLGPQRARFSATQIFPWFGTLGDRRTEVELNAKAKFEQFQEQRNRLFYNMEVIWADLFNIQEQIRLANENLEILNTLVNLSLRKYETGLVPQVDVLRAQIEQEDLKMQIQRLKDNQELLIKRFNELRNVDTNDPIKLPESLSEHSIASLNEEDWLQKISAQNPNLNQLRYKEEAAESAIQIAGNNGKPTFGIGLDYIATGERTDVPNLTDNGQDAVIARMSIKVPLFRGKYRAQTREASLNRSVAKDQILAGENQLETSFYSALRDLEDAQRRYQLYDEQQIHRVEQTVEILLQSYSSDHSQFEEILRLERKLFSYQLERVTAQSDEFKAIKFIHYLSGQQNITAQEINY